MTRIANLAQQTLINSSLFKLQEDLNNAQLAVSTTKKTQVYSGIPDQSERLVRLENLNRQSERYVQNNQVVDSRLQTQDIALVGIEETVRNMYDLISDYSSGERRDPNQVEQVQKFAYQALRDIQGFLNETIAGRHVFSGSRTSQSPVDLGLETDLAAFQAKFDGDSVKYPETRDAHILEFGVSDSFTFTNGGTGDNQYMEITLAGYAPADYSNFIVGADIDLSDTVNDGKWTINAVDTTTGYIRVNRKDVTDETSVDTFTVNRGSDLPFFITDTMTYAGNTVTAAAGTFDDIIVPATLTINSASGNNNMTVSVTDVSTDGSTLTITEKVATAAAGDAGTLTIGNYYNGDLTQTQHRLDENRVIDLSVNGLDPAFDKAIRALSIIAQGQQGTAGGLDQNTSRADDALWLLDSSLDFPTDGAPPYGQEEISSIEQIRFNNAFDRSQIKSTNEREIRTQAFLLGAISDVENVNNLEATTELLAVDRALQASYQVLSRTQNLGLANFL